MRKKRTDRHILQYCNTSYYVCHGDFFYNLSGKKIHFTVIYLRKIPEVSKSGGILWIAKGFWQTVSESAVATMSSQDAIMFFPYSSATNGLEVLELAKSRGIPTMLITRFRQSPAAKPADVVLCCGSNEGPFQFGSVPARIALLIVLDVLFQEYCYRNQESCTDSIRRISSALSKNIHNI